MLDEVVSGLPVREFRWYRNRKHYSGWYWSSTMEGLVAYESRLELARIMLADFDPCVVAVAAQPFRLIGADGARIRRHVPDILLVDVEGGVTVVDVKAPHKREDPDVRGAHASGLGGRSRCGAGGSRNGTARRRTLLANVSFLAGYRRRTVVSEDLIPAVRQAAAARACRSSI